MKSATDQNSTSGSLVNRITSGDPRAVARAISKVEDSTDDASDLMKQVFPHSGKGLVIGITGAPGAGKSSLVDKLASLYRLRKERVGIVAVDPSSPFSGGAILGDRIRMQTLGLDQGVFIRSMATRGNLGGLARATVDAVSILAAVPLVYLALARPAGATMSLRYRRCREKPVRALNRSLRSAPIDGLHVNNPTSV